jgi:hypothetical protein
MILTRRFGALRARPVFPSVSEHDNQSRSVDDIRRSQPLADVSTPHEEREHAGSAA